MTRWTYLRLVWTVSAEFDETEREWVYTSRHAIWRPGDEEPEERIARHRGESGAGHHPMTIALLAELGAEGWELVDTAVTQNAAGAARGYPEAGWAIARDWTFKQPAG